MAGTTKVLKLTQIDNGFIIVHLLIPLLSYFVMQVTEENIHGKKK
jgi:hypothetical protein